MKLKRTYLGFISLLSALFILMACAQQKPDWVPIQTIEYKQNVNYAGFINEQQGITVGYAGATFSTQDAGASWQQAAAAGTNWCRYGLDMIPGGPYWNCGVFQSVRLTDKGKTWVPMENLGSREPDHTRYLSFIDANQGFIATIHDLKMTDNGGKNWNSTIPLPGEVKTIAAIAAVPSPHAIELFIMDAEGRLWQTEDKGNSWKELASPVAGKLMNIFDSYAPLVAMRFKNANAGIIAANVKTADGNRPVVYRTNDLGNTWKQELVAPQEKSGNVFLSPDWQYLTVVYPTDNKLSVFKNAGAG
jgi:photosystem II stability/assembly factor-like uncharacterized protein